MLCPASNTIDSYYERSNWQETCPWQVWEKYIASFANGSSGVLYSDRWKRCLTAFFRNSPGAKEQMTMTKDEKTATKKVLVADDKAAGRELVRTVLENRGYLVFEACDGIEALAAAQRIRPDLIILDLHMPGLDGFGVIKELRLNKRFLETPVVALTGSAMQGDRQRALAAGFTGYITKPVPLNYLRTEVARLLA